MDVKLIDAKPDDLPRLLAWMLDLRRDDPMETAQFVPQVDSETAMRYLMSDPSLGRVWSIHADEIAVGYVAFTFCMSVEFGGRIGFIDELFIEVSHRRKGIGRRVIDLLQAAARHLDIRALRLEVSDSNPAAARLYASAGFVARNYQMMVKKL